MAIKKITSAQLSSPLSTNTTGTAANVTGTVTIGNGGTGATTASAALAALGGYSSANPSGYTSNAGTVTAVSGAGSVSGITLTGTVNTSGNINLGGTLSASIDNITDEHRLFNNMGQNHSTLTSFDAAFPSYNFGCRFVQGSVNGPNLNSASDYYTMYLGLGNEYSATGAGSYGMQLAIPRNKTSPYIGIRYNENNSLGGWQKISAGYADTAGNITAYTINQSLGTGNSPTFANVYTGNGGSVGIGDDVILTDVGIANNCRLQGQQNADRAGLIFGNSDNSSLYRIGTGPLTYQSNFDVQGRLNVGNSGTYNNITYQTGQILSIKITTNNPTPISGEPAVLNQYYQPITLIDTKVGPAEVNSTSGMFINVTTDTCRTAGPADGQALTGLGVRCASVGNNAGVRRRDAWGINVSVSEEGAGLPTQNLCGIETDMIMQTYDSPIDYEAYGHSYGYWAQADCQTGGVSHFRNGSAFIATMANDSTGWVNGLAVTAHCARAPILIERLNDGTPINCDSGIYMRCNTGAGWLINAGQSSAVGNGLYIKMFGGGGLPMLFQNSSGGNILYCDYIGNVVASGVYTPSDARLKKNIVNIESGLDSILRLRPVRYNWIDQEKDKSTQIGLIAQTTQEVIPELVHETTDGTLSVDYSKLVVILTKAIQEQQEMIAELNNRITTLEQSWSY